MVHHRILNIVLCARQKDLVYPFIYNSLYLLTPTSHHPSSNPLPLGNHESILYVCESVFVLYIDWFVSYFRFHI